MLTWADDGDAGRRKPAGYSGGRGGDCVLLAVGWLLWLGLLGLRLLDFLVGRSLTP